MFLFPQHIIREYYRPLQIKFSSLSHLFLPKAVDISSSCYIAGVELNLMQLLQLVDLWSCMWEWLSLNVVCSLPYKVTLGLDFSLTYNTTVNSSFITKHFTVALGISNVCFPVNLEI